MVSLDSIAAYLTEQPDQPPIEQWQPALNGDIDILIDTNGRWFHEGGEIQRQELVQLFASILRREDDGEYYLITPTEKWRIRVEGAPFMVVDMDRVQGTFGFLLNTGQRYVLSDDYQLQIDHSGDEPVPYLTLNRGLKAKLNRNVFYRLIDAADEVDGHLVLRTDNTLLDLGSVNTH